MEQWVLLRKGADFEAIGKKFHISPRLACLVRNREIIGEDASIVNSMITQGCIINGEVEGSVLFDNVHVGKGAKIVDSVLMPGVLVEEGAEVYKAIVDENCVIRSGTEINKEAKKVMLISDNNR